MRRNCTAVLHYAAVRPQLVTVSDKYRGLWSPTAALSLPAAWGGRKGRVTWEPPLSSFIISKLAVDSQDFKDYCDSIVADRYEKVTVQCCHTFPVTQQDACMTTQCL